MISRAIPKLPFIDKQLTIQFYTNQLGFTVSSDYGNYLIIDFPDAELHFFSSSELDPAKSDFMNYLRVNSDIQSFYQQCQEKGIAIHPNGKLETKPWGQKEFSITDPNGTLLTFGQEA